jgi:hypothetical protein
LSIFFLKDNQFFKQPVDIGEILNRNGIKKHVIDSVMEGFNRWSI